MSEETFNVILTRRVIQETHHRVHTVASEPSLTDTARKLTVSQRSPHGQLTVKENIVCVYLN